MNQALFEGISMGLLLSAMIGPVFFTLIQNSVLHGFRHSVVMALGILLSDLIYVAVTYFGVSMLVQNPYIELALGYGGSLVLIGFGIVTFIKKKSERPSSGGLPVPKAKKRIGFFEGFSINGINPFVMLFWISIAGVISVKDHFRAMDIFLFYVGILFTVFAIDILKAYVAKQLRRFVTPKLILQLNRVVAILLIVFGIRLFKFAMDKHVLLN